MKKYLINIFLMFLFSNYSRAQDEINIDPAKGRLGINIPLHTFDMGEFKVDVGISYSAKGYQVNADYGNFVGWRFYGIGSIRRTMRGLPDEKAYASGDIRKGWKGGSTYGWALNFIPADDLDESSCTDENSNYLALNNFGYDADLEPDLFQVEAPGLNCQLMMDNQGNFKAFPAQDLKVEFAPAVNPGEFWFYIITPGGIKYSFKTFSEVKRKSSAITNNVDLFKTEYNNFLSELTYTDTWYLTKMESLNTARAYSIDYEYARQTQTAVGNENHNIFIRKGSGSGYNRTPTYNTQFTYSDIHYLKKITSSLGSKLEVSTPTAFPDTLKVYNGNENQRPVDKTIILNKKNASVSGSGTRYFLGSITENVSECSKILYRFDYYGLPATGDAFFPVTKWFKKVDAWGYFNNSNTTDSVLKTYVYPAFKDLTSPYRPYQLPGYSGENYELAGNDPAVNEETVHLGTMSKIAYPDGGTSIFEYESNSFWDPDIAAEIKGAGIRIKSVSHNDGINPNVNTKKEFIYKTDANKTSGVINLLPMYAITTPSFSDPVSSTTKTYATIVSQYTTANMAYWNHLTVRSQNDFYQNESEVSYSQVTVQEGGNGKIKQLFKVPLSFWETSAKSLTYPAEVCNANNSTFIVKGYYRYPFAPVECLPGRTDLISEWVYNSDNVLLKKSEYLYEDYYTTPTLIYGILRDKNMGLTQFSKYKYQIPGTLTLQKKETVYDSNLAGNGITTQQDYTNTAYDRKVKTAITTNSDNSQRRISYTYSGDFASLTAGDINNDVNVKAIYVLNSRNIKNSILEQSVAVKPVGTSTFKTIESKASFFEPTSMNALTGKPNLVEIKSLKKLDGLTDFSALQIIGAGTNKVLSFDARYKTEQEFGDFMSYGTPSKMIENKQVTTLLGMDLLNRPLFRLVGAAPKNIAVWRYSTDTLSNFSIEIGQPSISDDHYLGKIITVDAGSGAFRRVFSRKAEDKFYKITFLAKAETTTTLVIQINGTVVGNISIPAAAGYKFYEKELNLTGISGGTLRIVPSLPIQITNLVFCPSYAEYTFTNHSYLTDKTFEMNSSGQASIYEYDVKGKLLCTRNLEGDVTQTNFYSYHNGGGTGNTLETNIRLGLDYTAVGIPVQFNGQPNCITGAKYTWDFDDGSPLLVTYDPIVYHTYSIQGNCSVKLKVEHPEYPVFNASKFMMIYENPDLNVQMCVNGIVSQNISNGSTIKNLKSCAGEVQEENGTRFSVKPNFCPGFFDYKFIWERSANGTTYTHFASGSGQQASVYVKRQTSGTTPENFYIRCRIKASRCNNEAITDPVYIQYNTSVVPEF